MRQNTMAQTCHRAMPCHVYTKLIATHNKIITYGKSTFAYKNMIVATHTITLGQ